MVIIQSAQSGGWPPSWLWPVVIFSLLSVASLYWGFIALIANKSDSESPLQIRIIRDGFPVENPADQLELNKAKLEGNSRVVIYEVCFGTSCLLLMAHCKTCLMITNATPDTWQTQSNGRFSGSWSPSDWQATCALKRMTYVFAMIYSVSMKLYSKKVAS
jgi:hypothetical protein